MDHEPGADGENRRLQQQPQHLRSGAEAADDVAGVAARCDIVTVKVAPAPGDAARHAHRRDRLGVAPARFQKRIARYGKLRGVAGRLARLHLGHDSERDQDDGTGERGQADIRMEQKANGEVDRHPRQVE
jgi:hypothetical protein